MDDTEHGPVLAVQAKTGELNAVLHTEQRGAPVTALVEVLDGTARSTRLRTLIAKVGAAAVAAGRPIWLDATRVDPHRPFGERGGHAFEDVELAIERELEARDARDLWNVDVPPLIPVLSTTASDREVFAVRMLLEHAPREVVLRSRGDRSQPAADIRRVLASARLREERVHLLLDEGYLDRLSPWRVRELIDVIAALRRDHDFASIGLLAGSTPRGRDDLRTRLRDRLEVRLHELVAAECGGALRYGDYGVVHPEPRIETRRWAAQPNPYIHYTVSRRSLFIGRRISDRLRNGSAPPGSAARHFVAVADELVARPEFAGPDFSWGDRQLVHCRYLDAPAVGTSAKWIALATSHHVAHLSGKGDAPTGDRP